MKRTRETTNADEPALTRVDRDPPTPEPDSIIVIDGDDEPDARPPDAKVLPTWRRIQEESDDDSEDGEEQKRRLFLLVTRRNGSESKMERWGAPLAYDASLLERMPLFKTLVNSVKDAYGRIWRLYVDLDGEMSHDEDSRYRWLDEETRERDFGDDALIGEIERFEEADHTPVYDGEIIGTIVLHMPSM